jgi:hypothetical protein
MLDHRFFLNLVAAKAGLNRSLFLSVTFIFCAIFSSCSTHSGHLSHVDPKNPPITHVVVCWLNNPKDDGAKEELVEASQSFRQIPGVLDVRVGKMIPSKRPQVDSTFDLAVVITFVDIAAMQAYEKNPIHLKAVQDVLKPHVRKFIVYDIAHIR